MHLERFNVRSVVQEDLDHRDVAVLNSQIKCVGPFLSYKHIQAHQK